MDNRKSSPSRLKAKNKQGIVAYCEHYQCATAVHAKSLCWPHYIQARRKQNKSYREKARVTQAKWNKEHRQELKTWREKHYQENKEKILKQSKVWYAKNKKRKSLTSKAYRKRRYHSDPIYREKYLRRVKRWVKETGYNKSEKVRLKRAQYRAENREKCREACRNHFRKNKKYYTAKTAKRRAALLRAILPGTDLKAIEEFYAKCPPGHEVDHKYPLQGAHVCGLHNIHNLQYLSVFENRSKGNRHVAS